MEFELEDGSAGAGSSGGERCELGDAEELEELAVVFHFCCFDSSCCFIAISLRRFIASIFAIFPIPLAASRSIRSEAANARTSRFDSSAAEATPQDGIPVGGCTCAVTGVGEATVAAE